MVKSFMPALSNGSGEVVNLQKANIFVKVFQEVHNLYIFLSLSLSIKVSALEILDTRIIEIHGSSLESYSLKNK